jgi:hypothetical protein
VFLRALLKVMAWSALLWALLMLPTLRMWPLASGGRSLALSPPDYLQSPEEAGKPALFVGEIQEAVYEIGRHCPLPPRKRLILLGGSGARGFEPELLSRATSAEEVLNLSLVLANFTQIRQVYDDLAACLGDEGMRQASFVLVPSLGSFTSNKMRFPGPYSDYETEKLRSHLFEGVPGAVMPVVGRSWLPLAIELWRPVMLARKLAVGGQARLDRLRARLHPQPAAPAPDREQSLTWIAELLPQEDASAAFAPEQTGEMERLVADIRARGSTVLLVEQPTQDWVRERSKAYADSHQTLIALAGKLALPYIDLSNTGADSEFHDGMHANAVGAKAWSERLVQALQALGRQQPEALGATAP